jgi:hypothetical protein
MKKYLIEKQGFREDEFTLLLDDGQHTNPTHANILRAYEDIASQSQPGDVVFCHYSGHGGKVRDDDGDEKDGYDETLVPVDYESAGQIRDDDVYKTLITPMKRGVTATCIYDCCHSGTVLDLPYEFKADGVQQDMTIPLGFDFNKLRGLMDIGMEYAKTGRAPTPQQAISAVEQLCGVKCNIM